jgi:hypothetical protein
MRRRRSGIPATRKATTDVLKEADAVRDHARNPRDFELPTTIKTWKAEADKAVASVETQAA